MEFIYCETTDGEAPAGRLEAKLHGSAKAWVEPGQPFRIRVKDATAHPNQHGQLDRATEAKIVQLEQDVAAGLQNLLARARIYGHRPASYDDLCQFVQDMQPKQAIEATEKPTRRKKRRRGHDTYQSR